MTKDELREYLLQNQGCHRIRFIRKGYHRTAAGDRPTGQPAGTRPPGNQLTALPPEIGQLANLQTLPSGGNRLTALPRRYGHLANLQTLPLEQSAHGLAAGDRPTGQPAGTFPPGNQAHGSAPGNGRLANLQFLNLGNLMTISCRPCPLRLVTGQPADTFPWRNLLTTLPPEIPPPSQPAGHLTSGAISSRPCLRTSVDLADLQVLELWRNKLTDLPKEIGQLAKLQIIDLSYNQLTALPPEIGLLANLQKLDLGSNQLTALPKEIGFWSTCSYLTSWAINSRPCLQKSASSSIYRSLSYTTIS